MKTWRNIEVSFADPFYWQCVNALRLIVERVMLRFEDGIKI